MMRQRGKVEAMPREDIQQFSNHGQDCTIRDLENKLKEKVKHIASLNSMLEKSRQKQNDEQRKAGALKGIVKDLESILKDKGDLIDSIRSKLEESRQKQNNLENELEEKECLTDLLRSRVEESRKKQDDLENELEEKEDLIDSLRSKLESRQKQNDLENELEEKDGLIDSLRNKLQESRQKLNDDLRKDGDLMRIIMNLRSKLKDKRDHIGSIRRKLEESRKELEESRQNQNDEQRKASDLQKIIENLENKLQDKGELIDSLKIKLEESREKQNDDLRRAGDLKKILTDVKSNLRDKEQLINSLKRKLDESREKQNEQGKANDLQKTIQDLENKLQDKGELIDTLKMKLEVSRQKQNDEQRKADDLKRTLESVLSISKEPQYSQFPYAELQQATNDFENSKKIGEGGYGNVYKGFLRHTTVAIKRLGSQSMQGLPEFHQEVNILTRVRHPNLVNLMGACSFPEPCLVYEFLPNGSLEDQLSCKNNTLPLSWQARIRIAAEICSALIFLHSHKPNSVVHGDLNPSNILLDANLVAKLSDFGICHLLPQSSATAMLHCTELRGTFPYIDPEFMSTGTLTMSSDVYSFGVIILQLLTGRPALGVIKAVQDALSSGNLQNILDKSAGEWPSLRAKSLARLGMRCCRNDRETRGKLETDVWWELVKMVRASSLESSTFQLKHEDDSHAPSYFLCPILQEVMVDPQVAADGFTYEAEAIKGWLDSGRNTSPMTNVELHHCELLPNHALRSVIQEWMQRQHCQRH